MERKFHNGTKNRVPGLRLLSGMEAEAMEPSLKKGVAAALYAPSTGTVNPWQLGIAACENAMANGCDVWCNETVSNIVRSENGYWITTSNKKVHAKAIINCAGLSADQVQTLLYPAEVSLDFDGADYLVMDKAIAKPKHVIFHETAEGKGITAVPCTEGNLLLESTARALTVPFASTLEGIQSLKNTVKAVLPQVDTTKVIRSFGAVRPNLRGRNGENISDFYIGNPAPDFYSLIGVKTPGLTCADALGRSVAEKVAVYLHAEENTAFSPVRKGIAKTDGQIICQCEQITKGEIIEAIKRGATTVDSIKRRVGTGMGRCQGSRCTYAIERLLEEEIHGENVRRAKDTI
jgi:glycerol-3-phosphate dehydrogenase